MKPTHVHQLPKGPPEGSLYGYCRSATRNSASLKRQRQSIEAACERHFGVRPIIVLEDCVEVPGELNDSMLLQLCRSNPGATIVTEDAARIGRNLQSLAALSDLAHRNDIVLVSVK